MPGYETLATTKFSRYTAVDTKVLTEAMEDGHIIKYDITSWTNNIHDFYQRNNSQLHNKTNVIITTIQG